MEWWKEKPVYQIYPRSFEDSNGDGVGDIPGIISRLDHIAALGAGTIWLSPVYPSPGIDNGYDISDYCGIDPLFGTLDDMDALIAEAGKRGIRIIMDLVVNHTSDEHSWFQKSRNREDPWTDYYIWRPGKNRKDGARRPEKLPNNWTSFFMEDAWEYDEKRGEYYLHLFHKKQPDLNYKNPLVIEEVKKIMKFWLQRGIAGFRCDVINVLYKTSLEDGKKSVMLTGLEHYKCQEGNHKILRELRRDVLDQYDCFTVGETALVTLPEAKLLSDKERRELEMVFYFDHLEADRRIARFVPKKFRAKELLKRFTKWQEGLEWNAVYLENHDQPRIVSHYGDDDGAGEKNSYWERSAKLLAVLEFTLRGTPFIYQGQEIGMTNFDFTSIDELKDVESHNLNRLMKKLLIPGWLRWKWLRMSSRDNARTPVQWNGSRGAGFSAASSWMGINSNYPRLNAAAQENDPESVLSFYKKMAALRNSSETLKYGNFRPLFADDRLMIYRREPNASSDGVSNGKHHLHLPGTVFVTALNFSRRRIRLNKKAGGFLAVPGAAIAASNISRTELSPPLYLEPWEAVVVKGE